MLVLIFLSVFHLGLSGLVQPYYDLENVEIIYERFELFKIKYNRSYSHDEETTRFRNFVENLDIINEMNKRNPLAVFDINYMSDWSSAEKRQRLGCVGTDTNDLKDSVCTPGDLSSLDKLKRGPDSIDWRDKNVVTAVKDQKNCGSCWAFAATGVVESAHALKTSNLVPLSEQELVDCEPTNICATKDGNVRGGQSELGFSYLIQNGGQMAEADYPYVDAKQKCVFDPSKAKVKVSSCKVYQPIPEDKLADLLAEVGPLAIYIKINAQRSTVYHSGVYTDCSLDGATDHAVLLIGYGTEGGTPYWLFKNSWNAGWGVQGFMKFTRGTGCLTVGSYAAYAVVE